MNVIIPRDRMPGLVGLLISEISPKFNSKDCGVVTKSDGDKSHLIYYDKATGDVFGVFYMWKDYLQLQHEIFHKLELYFGDDMTYVINWFNKEFDQDATSVGF